MNRSSTTGPPRPRAQRGDKLRRANELQAAALKLLRREGNWETTGGKHPQRLLHYEGTEFSLLHRTPFQPVPVSNKLVKEGFSERFQRELQKQYGLDIWARGQGKVASFAWNRRGPLEIVSFKRGAWESDFLTLCSGPPRNTT
jgi:hypothetical protein